jgi:hypothetical protein
MSAKLAQIGINRTIGPLVSKGASADLDVIETSTVAAMLHSFYTLIEKYWC